MTTFSLLMNGFPLPYSAVVSDGVIIYDARQHLKMLEIEMDSKPSVSRGYQMLVDQRACLREILKNKDEVIT